MSIKIFVSYSHKDKQYLADNSLLGFLKGLEKDGAEFWWDEKITAGEKWDDKIRGKLEETNIALVLVSQWFLDSPYCTNTEINSFLIKAGEGNLIILPIILSPCEWERHQWLSSRQSFPGGHETLEENYVEQGKQKRLFIDIRNALRKYIETKPATNTPKINTTTSLFPDFSGLGSKNLWDKDFNLINIFGNENTVGNVSPDKDNSWTKLITKNIVPADSIPTVTSYIAMKLDWDLDAIDSCNGLLTRNKLSKAIDKLHAEREKLVYEGSGTAYITDRIKSANEYLTEMEKRNIDALDYFPDQLKKLPNDLKHTACDILLNYGNWSSQITQEKVDAAKRGVNGSWLMSQNEKHYQLTLIKEVAKNLGLIG